MEAFDSVQSKHQHSQGTYIRIHGHLRGMDNKYPLVAFSIRPVVDFNEVRSSNKHPTGVPILNTILRYLG